MAEHILKAESEEDPDRGQDEDADAGMPTYNYSAILEHSIPTSTCLFMKIEQHLLGPS